MSISIENRIKGLEKAMSQDGNADLKIDILALNVGYAILSIKDKNGDLVARIKSHFDRAGIETPGEGHMGFYRDERTAYNAVLADPKKLAGAMLERVAELELASAVSPADSKAHAKSAFDAFQALESMIQALQVRRDADPDLWLAVAESARDIAKMAERAAHARP